METTSFDDYVKTRLSEKEIEEIKAEAKKEFMQRRLIEELIEIGNNTSAIHEAYRNIYSILNKLLSTPDKSFEVTFKGIEYKFIYPTTIEEKYDMAVLRKKLIPLLFKECLNKMVDYEDNIMNTKEDPWWIIEAFASGIDTLDMQIEIVGKEEHLNQTDADGKRVTALPLDMDNYQIDMQKPDVEFEDDTKTEKLDSI